MDHTIAGFDVGVDDVDAVIEHEKHARALVDRLSHSSSRGELEL